MIQCNLTAVLVFPSHLCTHSELSCKRIKHLFGRVFLHWQLGKVPTSLSNILVAWNFFFFLFGPVCSGHNFRTKGYSQGILRLSCLISFHLFLTPLKNWLSWTDPTWTCTLPGLSRPALFRWLCFSVQCNFSKCNFQSLSDSHRVTHLHLEQWLYWSI